MSYAIKISYRLDACKLVHYSIEENAEDKDVFKSQATICKLKYKGNITIITNKSITPKKRSCKSCMFTYFQGLINVTLFQDSLLYIFMLHVSFYGSVYIRTNNEY